MYASVLNIMPIYGTEWKYVPEYTWGTNCGGYVI